MKKLPRVLCLLYIAIALLTMQSCSDDLSDITGSSPINPVIPNYPDGLVINITFDGGFGAGNHTFSDSGRVDSIQRGLNTLFVGSTNQPDSIIDQCWYFNSTDSVHMQSVFRQFNNVGEQNRIEYKVWKQNGTIRSTIFLLRPVNYYGPGGTGDIEFKGSIINLNGMRTTEIALPDSRLPGQIMNRSIVGPVTNWIYVPLTNILPGRAIYTHTQFDGFYSEFNYASINSPDTIWSLSDNSHFQVDNNLYGIVYYGSGIYSRGSAPIFHPPGTGDSTFTVEIVNDSVIVNVNNQMIPGIGTKLNKYPYIKTKVTQGNWSGVKYQKLFGTSGWGRGGLKKSTIDSSTHLVYLKYFIDNLEADYTHCFAYDPVNHCITFAVIGGNRPYITAVVDGVRFEDMPMRYPQLIRYIKQ